MSKLVATLASTTVLFAASTAYFAYRLHERESEDVTVTANAGQPSKPASALADNGSSSPAASRSGAPTAKGASPAAVAAAASSAASPAVKSAGAVDHQREVMQPFAKDWLRQYDDPAQRVAMTKAARAGIESQYSRLKDRLKLDAGTFSQLVELLTEEQLDQQAVYFRCLVNSACDTSKLAQPRDRSDELLALLGADNYAQFTSFRTAIPEWQSVVQLRGRLSESISMKDSDAERLFGALSAERERFSAEANQSGAKLHGWGNGTGMLWYAGDGGAEEQFASATQYSERLRERASAVLTAEQLRAFTELQEEMLAGLASYLRSQSGQ